MCQSRPTNWIMKTLLTFILCLIGLSALSQGNALLRNRYTTNADSATVHGDHLDALKADKLATGIADPARLGSGTANAGTALFGDSSWKIISASGNLVAEGTNGITAVTNGQLVTISFNGLNVVLSNASFQGPFTGVGAAAGKVVLNSGSGTGGYFDYSGATASNHLVAMVDGRFVDGGSTNAGGSQVWTNYGGFIFPAGEPAPDTNSVLAGPSMFFTPHGSLILGTNAVLWGQPVDDPNIAIMVNHYVTNGDPSTLNIIFNETLDTNGTFYSFVELQMQADKDHPSSQLSMDVVATNGLEFQTYIQATDGQPHFLAQTNSTDVFSVSANGLVTANGFTDNSGTPGSLVAYQGGNRLGPTNSGAITALGFVTTNDQRILTFGGPIYDTNGGIFYGDANLTNAVYIGPSGETLSNANGSVTISGGTITSKTITDTNLSLWHSTAGTQPLVVYDNTSTLGSTTNGITLTNTTVTTTTGTANQSYSPPVIWEGQGWDSTASASKRTAFRAYVKPASAAGNPTAQWTLESSINGGAFGSAVTADGTGTLAANNNLQAGGSAVIRFNTRSQMSSTADKVVSFVGNSANAFDAIFFGPVSNTWPTLLTSTNANGPLISTTSGISASGSNSWTGSNYFSQALLSAANGAWTGSNYFQGAVTTSTNQNQITPDFSVEEQLITTNAAFTFLAPVGVDTTLKTVQWHLCNVTNSSASAVAITSPANCHTVGTAWVTNWTAVWFQVYASKITNAYYVPVF